MQLSHEISVIKIFNRDKEAEKLILGKKSIEYRRYKKDFNVSRNENRSNLKVVHNLKNNSKTSNS